MTDQQTVRIAEAKGRPMLHWVGKRPLDHVTAYPAQLVERFDPLGKQTSEVFRDLGGLGVSGNLLFHGDNKDVLAWLLAHGYRGKVNLIYIDPPFDSGADYVRQVQLRGMRTAKLEGESHSLGEQIQYTDIWANDMYLQFMYERLLLIKELLSEAGSVYLHCDYRKSSHLRCLMDEVFGSENLRNHLIWQRIYAHNDPGQFGHNIDHILYYVKSDDAVFNTPYVPYSEEYIEKFYKYVEPETGRRYRLVTMTSPHPRPNLMYEWKGYPHPEKGWRYSREVMAALDAEGRLHYPEDPQGRVSRKYYLDEMPGAPAQELWTDINSLAAQSLERKDYPTQKPETLVKRIVHASSNPGDLVLDCFVGSGTTAAVAQKLGRRWIAADVNKGAMQTTSKRLQTVIQEQIEAGAHPRQLAFESQTSEVSETSEVSPPPAALSFSVYRVNDYDLQVQHNEAVNLAVELVGVERTKTDPFFDGTRGAKLVKIVPFNHPLTPLDLQLLQDELKARPGEERDVVVVCLGAELAVDAWLEDYNRRRPVNHIEVIELRTDQKYGKFFLHQPAQAQVHISRQAVETSEVFKTSEVLVVEIEDFISPTIVERLEMDTPLFKAHIPDWRAMVDVVMIDTAYNGEVFNIALSDVPERKDDLVVGRYELPAPEGETTVAVKIVDMLGEEVLTVAEV